MPRFDPETIAALAEGRLSPDEAARVEAAVSADPDALAELELQRAAIEALGAAPQLHLTELESAGLRASVADALGLADTAVEVAATPRRVPWGSLGIAAAALLGLVAIVPVVGLLNTGGGDAADTALAPAATSSADRSESSPQAESDEAAADTAAITEDGGFDAGQEAPGEDLLGFGSSTTLAARTTTTVVGTTAADESTTTITTELDPSTTEPQTPRSEEFEAIVADLAALYEDPEAVEEIAAEALDENLCWTEDTESHGGTDPGDRWSFEYDDGERTVVVFFQYDDEGAPGPFTIYEIDECSAIAEIPEAP